MIKIVPCLCLFFVSTFWCSAQLEDRNWLLGSYNQVTSLKGIAKTDSVVISIQTEMRKMPFKGTQSNFSDHNGILKISSNGVWIASSTNDTMVNGTSLNPNGITGNWPFGLPIFSNNILLPHPGDSTIIWMFHHTLTQQATFLYATELYYTIIDMKLDSGRGAVTSKNMIAINDTLYQGLTACKHANGVDWWIICFNHESDEVNKLLLTENGLQSMGIQALGYSPIPFDNASQLTYSKNGDMLLASTFEYASDLNSKVVLANFDRCTGDFWNVNTVKVSSSSNIWGLAFSPSGEFAYACTPNYIFQINTGTLSVDTVAIYDGFISPPTLSCCQTTFWNMYLGANDKIYVTSGSSVKHITVIEYPDSAGVSCNVQQHAIELPGNWRYLRAVPNHPNYRLGSITGSPCDTITGISEIGVSETVKLSIIPNPSNGSFDIKFTIPKGETGTIEVGDLLGKIYTSSDLYNNQGTLTVNVNFPAGIYYCKLKTRRLIKVKKIIIQ